MDEAEAETDMLKFIELAKKAGIGLAFAEGRWMLKSDQSELGKGLSLLAKELVDENSQRPTAYLSDNPRNVHGL